MPSRCKFGKQLVAIHAIDKRFYDRWDPFCPRKIVVTATKDSILLMLGLSEKYCQECGLAAPSRQCRQQADERCDENNCRKYAKGEVKPAPSNRTSILGPTSEPKIRHFLRHCRTSLYGRLMPPALCPFSRGKIEHDATNGNLQQRAAPTVRKLMLFLFTDNTKALPAIPPSPQHFSLYP